MAIDHTNKNMLYLIQTKGGVKMNERNILCIDLKSFFASVECVERNLDPFTTPLIVADPSRKGGAIT